jgi:spore coat polysaccharide biosynthesis predicted glycosyltransferase SpsG
VKIAFICNGGNIPEIGFGHFSRCTRMAEVLMKHGHQVCFVISEASEMPPIDCSVYRAGADSYGKVFASLSPDIIFVDMLNTEPAFMKMLKKRCRKLITIDNKTGGHVADLVISGGVVETGNKACEYVITHPRLNCTKKKIRRRCKRIFVSFGGYDHHDLTIKTADALRYIGRMEVNFIIGENYEKTKELADSLRHCDIKFNIYKKPSSYHEILRNSDLAITNGGLTMFDAMACGIPTLVIAQYDHQRDVARRYGDAVDFIGKGDKVGAGDIITAVYALLVNYDGRREMSERAQEYVDGKGLGRVVKLITERKGMR